jgi:FKBP12-rapamycin complex-associated protein
MNLIHQIVTTYENFRKNKEDGSRLLSFLISSSQKLIKPYVEPILKVLLPKLQIQQTPAVIAGIMASIGELSNVGGEDLCPYLSKLCPIIIETLQDQSSSTKRKAALKTLGQLACSTSYVIEPYLAYPNLLLILIGILKTEQIPFIRRETLKLMGIIGALDPYRYKVAQRDVESDDIFRGVEEEKSKSLGDIDPAFYPMMSGLSPSNDDYYPTVVIHSLMRILKDQSLSAHHTGVIQAVMVTFKSLGLKCVPFLPVVSFSSIYSS